MNGVVLTLPYINIGGRLSVGEVDQSLMSWKRAMYHRQIRGVIRRQVKRLMCVLIALWLWGGGGGWGGCHCPVNKSVCVAKSTTILLSVPVVSLCLCATLTFRFSLDI